MYLSLLLLLCSSLLPASTTATCYNPPSQSNKLVAVNTVGTICSGLEGFFRQDEPRDACVTDKATGTEWRFFVERMGEKNTPDGTLDHTSCINAFNQELSKCKQGAGYHELGGFHFSLSSFEGMCVDAGYINGHRRVKKDVQPTPVAGSSDKKVTWKDGDIIVWNTGYLPSDPKNDPGDQHPKRMVEFSG